MASMMINVLVTIFVGWQVVCSAKIEITPIQFNGLVPTAVNISCVPGIVGTCSKEIVVIQILRTNQMMASLQRGSNIVYSADLTPNLQANGYVDPDVRNSFLNLTMKHLMSEDSDVYTCVFYFIDELGFVVEERDENQLVLNDLDLQPHVKYLFHKIFVEEDLNKDQARKLKDLEQQLKILEFKLKKTESNNVKTFAALEDTTKNLSEKIDDFKDRDLVKRIELLEDVTKNQSLNLSDLNEKDGYVSAFTAGYNGDRLEAGKVVKFRGPVTSQGQGYNQTTSLFTAPTKGIYAFQLVATSHSDKEMRFDIQVNDGTVAIAFADYDKDWDQGTTGCVVKLNHGDVVRVIASYANSDGMMNFPYTLFSGFLVKAL